MHSRYRIICLSAALLAVSACDSGSHRAPSPPTDNGTDGPREKPVPCDTGGGNTCR